MLKPRSSSSKHGTRQLSAYERKRAVIGITKRQHGLCAICKEPMPLDDRSLDHIIPVSKWPIDKIDKVNIWSNLRLTHLRCNIERGNTDVTS